MRTSPPDLLPLFRSDMQAELLGLLLLQPTRAWTLDDLASASGAPTSSVHREVLRAVDAGLATRDDGQRPHRYQAAEDSPAFQPMRDLLELTVGVAGKLRKALAGRPEISAAAIHGGWARGKVTPSSDIDVLLVADGDPTEALRAIRRVCRRVGRDADTTVLTSGTAAEMSELDTPFWRKALDGPRIELLGDLDAAASS